MVPTSPAQLYTALEAFIMRLMNLAEADGMDALAELDLSFSQARTLFTLAHHDQPLPIHVIARRVGLSDAAAGRNVDALVKLGLVERREDPHDRRVKLVSITEAGRSHTSQHLDAKRASVREFAERLPEPQRSRFHECLSEILASPHLCSRDHHPEKQENPV